MNNHKNILKKIIKRFKNLKTGSTDNNYNQFEQTINILNKMGPQYTFDTDKAWQKMEQKLINDNLLPQNMSTKKTIKLNSFYKYAAAVALLITVSAIWFFNNKTNTLQYITVYANNDITQPVILPDSSKIYLYNNASIKFNKGLKGSVRQIELNGEAFFNVTPNKQKPFIVKTQNATVKVLGTSFLVKPGNNQTTVVVKTGLVEFAPHSHQQNKVLIEPGFYATQTNGIVTKQANTDINYMCWVDRTLNFKNTPLVQVINKVNKTYNSNIVLADSSLNNLMLTATFTNITVQNIIESLELTFKLKALPNNNKTILALQ